MIRRVLHVVGARPNFMKVAPVHRALDGRVVQTLVHTGQHYDAAMSEVFFQQLGIPTPDFNLEVGSDTHARQTAQVMTALEPVLKDQKPDLVMVYGDVNSTMAAALVCSKLQIPVAHVEAGLRSRDRTMPEEINRIVTDRLADVLLTPSADADENLIAEGVAKESIHLVGNVMIDTLVRFLPLTDPERLRREYSLGDRFALVTLHRPSNVDDPESLARIMAALGRISERLPVLFPMHPRTLRRIQESGVQPAARLNICEPIGYLEFLGLQRIASVVITDSGGIQEETTYLRVPCLTLRENTERPITVSLGTNTLIGRDMERLEGEIDAILAGRAPSGSVPPLWDGHAGNRIADLLGTLD